MQQPSASVFAQLQTLYCFQAATSIGVYIATKTELDLLPYLKLPLSLPRFNTTHYEYAEIQSQADLISGKFNILEPNLTCTTTSKLDLMLIPGVRFDKYGNRKGHGHGYFDRLLEHEHGIKIGICYDEQVSPTRLKAYSHDIRMDILITPTQMRYCY